MADILRFPRETTEVPARDNGSRFFHRRQSGAVTLASEHAGALLLLDAGQEGLRFGAALLAVGQLSGAATRKLCERMFQVYRDIR